MFLQSTAIFMFTFFFGISTLKSIHTITHVYPSMRWSQKIEGDSAQILFFLIYLSQCWCACANIFTYAPCVQLERYIRLKSILFSQLLLCVCLLYSSFVFSFNFFPPLCCLLIYYVQKKNCYRWSIFNFFCFGLAAQTLYIAQESAKKKFITKYAHTVDPRLF